MKYLEIIEKISEKKNEAARLEAAQAAKIDEWHNLIEADTVRARIEARRTHAEAGEKILTEAAKIGDSVRKAKIEIELLQEIAKKALFDEVKPEIIDTLNKFSGKAYGPATTKKIYEELKQKTNCAIYIYADYWQHITINPLHDGYTYGTSEQIKIDFGNDQKILVDNKIQLLKAENARLIDVSCKDCTVDTIPEYIEKLEKAAEDVKQAKKALEELEKAYKNISNEEIRKILK